MTRGAGEPLTLQSKRALRPSMTSMMSSLRVNRGSLDGVTLRFALEVNSSVSEETHRLKGAKANIEEAKPAEVSHLTALHLWLC